jgi:hypothetical protein
MRVATSARDSVPPDEADVTIVRRRRIIGPAIIRADRLEVGRRVGGCLPAAGVVVRLDRPIDPQTKRGEKNYRG